MTGVISNLAAPGQVLVYARSPCRTREYLVGEYESDEAALAVVNGHNRLGRPESTDDIYYAVDYLGEPVEA